VYVSQSILLLFSLTGVTTQYRFDDEVKDGEHGAFTPKMMALKQSIWIQTFLEGVTDDDNEPIFDALAWFAYKLSGVICSASACEHCWSIAGWIHSKRQNKLGAKMVERLVRAHTNLVLREALDLAMECLLPWDIELVIEEPEQESD
jgi:hypothetical protein